MQITNKNIILNFENFAHMKKSLQIRAAPFKEGIAEGRDNTNNTQTLPKNRGRGDIFNLLYEFCIMLISKPVKHIIRKGNYSSISPIREHAKIPNKILANHIQSQIKSQCMPVTLKHSKIFSYNSHFQNKEEKSYDHLN